MAHFISLKCDCYFQDTLILNYDLNTDSTVYKYVVPQTVERGPPPMKLSFLCVNYCSCKVWSRTLKNKANVLSVSVLIIIKSWLHSVFLEFLELCMMVLIYTLSFDSVLIQLTTTQLSVLKYFPHNILSVKVVLPNYTIYWREIIKTPKVRDKTRFNKRTFFWMGFST